MLKNQKITVVLPAYNAAQTLQETFNEIPQSVVDDIILVDDGSYDQTAALSRQLGIYTVEHAQNRGYGANQKTCYRLALERGADIVIMLHPDYQYAPELIAQMAETIAADKADVVLASRMMDNSALSGGMPRYKYVGNRILTWLQNRIIGQQLSEYHTGYRAWSRAVLEALPLEHNSNDFVFDNEMLAQAIYNDFRIAEIACPTHYFAEASSIGWGCCLRYAMGVIRVSFLYAMQKRGWLSLRLFKRVSH